MAYDDLRQKTVLFGGLDSNGHELGDTWQWQIGGWFRGPDLRVSSLVVSSGLGREGEKVAITATIANDGQNDAPASNTEFLLDPGTGNPLVLGLVETPALAAGASTQVSILWDTRSLKGTHTIQAIADRTGRIIEADESNNSASVTVVVRGNQVNPQ